MITIKDIAKLAKVSQGTVSNVLNQKDNVSSDKIERVLNAAKTLGYIPNESAKSLRKGYTNQLHLLLPNIRSQAYTDIYHSFKKNAFQHGLTVNLMISDDNIEEEMRMINRLIPELNSNVKIAVVTSMPYGERYENLPSFALDNILFLVKDYIDSKHFLSFDYSLAGKVLGSLIKEEKVSNVCILSNLIQSSNEIEFQKAINKELESKDILTKSIQIDPLRKHQSILEYINNQTFEAFFLSDFEFASTLKDIVENFSTNSEIPIYVVSPVFIMPENDFIKYELNYRLLGHVAAEEMIKENLQTGHVFLEGSKTRDFFPKSMMTLDSNKIIKVLTVDNPSATVLKSLAIQYTKVTGIDVEISIKNYDEVFKILSNKDLIKEYDVIRNDINWMSWFAKDIFMPLDPTDKRIENVTKEIIDGLLEEYLYQDDLLYGLPFSPSTQVLYYRKDLFERYDIKRLFKEEFNHDLKPPKDFESFNLIAEFFSQDFNPNSPTKYGATLTLGNTGVAGSEFLSRFFSKKQHLYDEKGKLDFSGDIVYDALRQIRELKKYTNKKYCNWWTDTAQAFSSGNVAMAIMYSNYASELLSFNSKIINRIGQAPVPGNNPLMGGGVIGIAKYSDNSENAMNFIAWLSSETVSSSGSLLGNLPSHKKTFNYYEILDKYPWYVITKKGIEISKCYRVPPTSNIRFNEKEMLEIIGSAIIKVYLDDELDINEVQKETQLLLDKAHDDIHK